MTRFSADSILDELTDFQRRSVTHAVHQLYEVGSSRFLVADETGLGKSMVARGVIARAIERLQDDPSVKRIDIVYVCANTDLAQQNLSRLNVTEDEEITFSSRLTLLGKHSSRLHGRRQTGGKPVNLVSFTPGTSFDFGHSTGKAEERAMLFLALQTCISMDTRQRTAAQRLLQGTVQQLATFRNIIAELQRQLGDRGIDRAILRQFRRLVRQGGRKSLAARVERAIDDIGRRQRLPSHVEEEKWLLIRELRSALARASVETLEPDLVILDEFQRFRHLLDTESPAGELAHELFEYPDTKVLLLSATPYKPFTYAEERDDDHATNFFQTLSFLADGAEGVRPESIRAHLDDYRHQVVTGGDPSAAAAAVREQLLRVMSRQERPVTPGQSSWVEEVQPAQRVTADDLAGYAALHDVARAVRHERDRGLVTAEYWKSAPYFINFCDGYQLGARLREHAKPDAVVSALGRTQHLRAQAMEDFAPVDPANARMRDLVDATVGQDWWKLLWVPPSLPYLQPQGPYAQITDVTKMLVFSSWTATPAAVASLLSYEAERRAAERTNYTHYTPEARRRLTQPLNYSVDRSSGRPRQMSTLMIFWPMPGLASRIDPLVLASENGGAPMTATDAEGRALEILRQSLAPTQAPPGSQTDPSDDSPDTLWRFAFSLDDVWPQGTALREVDVFDLGSSLGRFVEQLEDDEAPSVDYEGIDVHVQAAASARTQSTQPTERVLTLLTQIVLHSPANIAYRALSRVLGTDDEVGPIIHSIGAGVLANGLRSLFNRPDVTKIVERVVVDDLPYWHKVLQYCASGNLQSVLDEYVHHLRHDQFKGPLDKGRFVTMAGKAADAISLRTTTYQAIDIDSPDASLRFVPRFALRYGGRKTTVEDARQPEVRNAFNSPFWPFVLTSTSVGQEGIDFHWWCHSVFHWNTPANPVDFEQREGRVDRYRGHAVRRNVASHHGQHILAQPGRDPWITAFDLAAKDHPSFGDFSPSWVYPGPAKVRRHVAPFVLSSDGEKYERIKRDVALYRLAFGQPRQEDMIELLRRRGLHDDIDRLMAARIDLAP